MKRTLWLLACLAFPACALFQRPFRPVRAPPAEAAQIEIPMALPEEGRQVVRGPMAAAIQLAMDDFLPRDLKLPRDATPEDVCLHSRESYDVFAAPGPEGVVFVRLILGSEACRMNGILFDMEATYAIDVKGWRILAIKN
jgi:hypothetical protein